MILDIFTSSIDLWWMLASKNQIASLLSKKKNTVSFSKFGEIATQGFQITSQAEGDENPACRHMHFTYPGSKSRKTLIKSTWRISTLSDGPCLVILKRHLICGYHTWSAFWLGTDTTLLSKPVLDDWGWSKLDFSVSWETVCKEVHVTYLFGLRNAWVSSISGNVIALYENIYHTTYHIVYTKCQRYIHHEEIINNIKLIYHIFIYQLNSYQILLAANVLLTEPCNPQTPSQPPIRKWGTESLHLNGTSEIHFRGRKWTAVFFFLGTVR